MPAGLDIEVAQATAWLVARGLPAFDSLIQGLGRASDRQAFCFSEVASGDPLNATNKEGALIAPALVDLVVANAGETVGRLAVGSLCAALYLLPAAARYASDGWCFHFELLGAGGVAFQLQVEPDAGVSIAATRDGDVTALEGISGLDVQACCTRSIDALPNRDESSTTILADAASLAEVEAKTLGNGVEVESETWDLLTTFALKVLVPATEESRQRGAGGA